MTKQVALANKTYARLRQAKRKEESFSSAIERLLDAGQRLDPMEAIRRMPKPAIDWDEALRIIEEEREATRQPA